MLTLASGCYAPLRSPGVPANCLPDAYRIPHRLHSVPLNYGLLSLPAIDEYVLGRDDVIQVEIQDLLPKTVRLPQVGGGLATRPDRDPRTHSSEVRVTNTGDILLPLVGSVLVGGKTIEGATRSIVEAYQNGVVDDPKVMVSLVGKSTKSIMVLGEVSRPDVYELPNDQNDIAHAISRAGGLTDDAGDEIQVHRNRSSVQFVTLQDQDPRADSSTLASGQSEQILASEPLSFSRIPLRSTTPVMLTPEQITLHDGDVVIIPKRTDEVFFVVGKLNADNLVRFSVGRDNRDLGNGFVLPNDRDVDVVTAVAMAGYIDPIDSPTTVTVHRTREDGSPLLLHVDLIAARYDRMENIMVMPGDIIYLNPDASWWFRRTLDRVIPDLLTFPYERSILKAFGQARQ